MDDPHKIKSSLQCGTGGDSASDARSVMMSSFSSSPSSADRLEKNINGRVTEEMNVFSGQKSCIAKEVQLASNMGSLPTKLNMMNENGYNCGRGDMLKNLPEGGSYGAGRGAVFKRSNMMESPLGGGGCGAFPKRSIEPENVVGKAPPLQKELDKSPTLKCSIPKKSLPEIPNSNAERSAAVNDLKCLPKAPMAEKLAVPTSAAAGTPGNSASAAARTPGDSASGNATSPGKSARSMDSAPALHGTTNSSIVSPSNSAPETRPSFESLLEIGEAYSGFISLATSYEQFTGVVVIEAVSCIFNEAHDILSTVPVGVNFKPKVGSLVAAYSPTEQTWYRARVLEEEGSTYKVCYVDFGNKEAVELVKPLPEGPFSELPELAFLAKLHGKISDQVQEKLKKMVQADQALKFKVIAKKGVYVKVALCEEDDEHNTTVAEYILGPLLTPAVSPSPPAASPPKPKPAPSTDVRENIGPNCSASTAARLKEATPPRREMSAKMLGVNGSPKENGVISSDKGKSVGQVWY